jgi:LuxR family maltose regulon positive regulatory protein
VRLLSLKAFIAYALEDFERCIQWTSQAQELLGDSITGDHGVFLLNLGQAQWAAGEMTAAIATVQQSISASQTVGDAFAATSATGVLLKFLRLQGRLQEGLRLGRRAIQQYLDQRGEPLPLLGFVFIYLAKIEYELNELDDAYSHARTGILLCQEMGDLLTMTMGEMLLAQLEQAFGRETEAMATLRELHSLVNDPRVGKLLMALEADITLKQGDRTTVDAWSESNELAPAGYPTHIYESAYLTYVRWLLAEKRLDEAGALLNTMARSAREQGRDGSLVSINLLQSIGFEAQGDHTAARESLVHAVTLAAAEGHLRPFHDELPQIRMRLEAIRLTAPEFIDLALAVPVRSPIVRESPLSDPLHEREGEILRLMAAGLSNPDIARELFLTVNTVKWYAKSLFQKLGVHSRTGAVTRAKDLGII